MTTRAKGCSGHFRLVARIVGALGLVCTCSAYGLGLGEMRVASALGEPLQAEIELLSVSAEELSTLDVELGAREVFDSAGVSRPAFLNMLEFEVIDSAPPRIRVTTEQPMNEPFLHLIIRARWEFGMILGEYTALLDPPLYGQQQAESASTPFVLEETEQPEVSTLPEETAVPQPAAPQPEVDGTGSGGFVYGPVTPGDNLWGIASVVDTSGLNANIFQVMIALLRENPGAFIDNNINRLKAGETLRLSDRQSIVLISKAEASRTYAAQIEQWEGGRAPDAMAASEVDQAMPRTEILEEEAEPVQQAPAEPEPSEMAKTAGQDSETGADTQTAGADKDKYVFKIAPPTSEAGEGAPQSTAELQMETEAMRFAIDREIMALREQVARLELQQKESEAASSTEAEIAAIKAEAQTEIRQLKDQIAFLRQAAANQEIEALRGQIAAMKQADAMTADASGATAALSQAQQEIRDLRAQVAALTQAAEEKATAPAQPDFSDLSDQVEKPKEGEAAADPDAQVEAIRLAANQQIESMREQMEAMRAEMGKLLEAQQQRESENTQLEKRVEELVGMLEGKVESTSLATLTTPAPGDSAVQTETPESADAGGGAKKVRMVADSGGASKPVWEKWLDELPGDDESRIAIGAGILLILLVLWLMVRRRRSLMRMEESILMSGGNFAGTESQLSEIRSKKPRYLSDLSMAGMGRMEAAEVDPLAEAEVYLAYGRAGQAIQVLKEAAGRNPERKELKLKLLEIYQQQADVKSFDDLVSEMDLSEASVDQAAWNKVVELKLKMHEDSPLGTAAPAASASPAATRDEAPARSADEDWELRLDEVAQGPEKTGGQPDSALPHDILEKSSGPVDPTLRPFPEPDDNARVGEDVLGTLGRPAESSGAGPRGEKEFERRPDDPNLLNFNTTNPSELNFDLDPDETETVRLDSSEAVPEPGDTGDRASSTAAGRGGQVNEVSIKAELAEAYLNMGDKEEALRILEEIAEVAGPEDKQRIVELVRRANS